MILVWAATFLEMVMKQLQYLFRLFVALIALLSARAVYARQEVLLKIDVIRLDPRLDKLVQLNAKIEKIARWSQMGRRTCLESQEKYLLFSDVPNNSIYKWQEGRGESLFLKPTGYTGKARFEGSEPGSKQTHSRPRDRTLSQLTRIGIA